MIKLEESKVILNVDRDNWRTPREIRNAIFRRQFGNDFEIFWSYSDKHEEPFQARIFYRLLEEVHICLKGIDAKIIDSRAKELTDDEKIYSNSQMEYRLTEDGLKLQEEYKSSVEIQTE